MQTTSQIAITVNGTARQVEDQLPLAALLADMGIDVNTARGVAVALDDTLVRRPNWATCFLHDGARVEIVTAKQGG